MYALESNLQGQPVVSLQTGQAVARIGQPVLDIASLEIKGFECEVDRAQPLLLLMADIRQFAGDCLIIDDEEQLTSPTDIVRLEQTLKAHYSPISKPVYSDTGRRVGSVADYNINLETNRIQQIFVRQRLWRSWFSPNLIIDRTQILDVTPERITVRDATITDTVLSTDSLPEINP